MSRKACNTCSTLILRWMQTGEKTFTSNEIQKFVHHPPCTACGGKPGREFICRVCEMGGFKWKKPEIIFRKAPSTDLIDALNVGGGAIDAVTDIAIGGKADQAPPPESPRPRRRALLDPQALLNQIVQLLPGQVETFPKIVDGRRRGTSSRTRYLTNAEIAEQVGCTPQYVGQVREWLSTDDRFEMENRNPGWYVQPHEEVRVDLRDHLPSRGAAIALYKRLTATQTLSPAKQQADAEYKKTLQRMIAHSTRHFRTGGGGTGRG